MLPKIINAAEDREKVAKILERFYRNYHKNYKNYGSENSEKSSYEPYANFIEAYVTPKARILDIGSGSSRLPEYIAKKGYEVFGCDFFPKGNLSEFKLEKVNTSCRVISGSGYSLPFKSESFDAVVTLNVLEHIVFVDKFLEEMNRILKRDGVLMISCPNWSGLNAPIRALISIIFMKKRYWQYEKIKDAIFGIFRSFIWYFNILLSNTEPFILIFPRLKSDSIDFIDSDDDCVHLCQPLSFKKWLKNHNYKILKYNRIYGNNIVSKVFNSLFPSFATTNNIVGKKYTEFKKGLAG